jgi:hypothetical protein
VVMVTMLVVVVVAAAAVVVGTLLVVRHTKQRGRGRRWGGCSGSIVHQPPQMVAQC